MKEIDLVAFTYNRENIGGEKGKNMDGRNIERRFILTLC
jgi:hypothetical protein